MAKPKLLANVDPSSYFLYDKDPDDPDVPLKAALTFNFHEECLEEVPLDARGLSDDGDAVTIWLNLDTTLIEGKDVAPIDFSIKTLKVCGMTNDDLSEPDLDEEITVEIKFRNGWAQVWGLRDNVMDSEKAQSMKSAFAAAFDRANSVGADDDEN